MLLLSDLLFPGEDLLQASAAPAARGPGLRADSGISLLQVQESRAFASLFAATSDPNSSVQPLTPDTAADRYDPYPRDLSAFSDQISPVTDYPVKASENRVLNDQGYAVVDMPSDFSAPVTTASLREDDPGAPAQSSFRVTSGPADQSADAHMPPAADEKAARTAPPVVEIQRPEPQKVSPAQPAQAVSPAQTSSTDGINATGTGTRNNDRADGLAVEAAVRGQSSLGANRDRGLIPARPARAQQMPPEQTGAPAGPEMPAPLEDRPVKTDLRPGLQAGAQSAIQTAPASTAPDALTGEQPAPAARQQTANPDSQVQPNGQNQQAQPGEARSRLTRGMILSDMPATPAAATMPKVADVDGAKPAKALQAVSLTGEASVVLDGPAAATPAQTGTPEAIDARIPGQAEASRTVRPDQAQATLKAQATPKVEAAPQPQTPTQPQIQTQAQTQAQPQIQTQAQRLPTVAFEITLVTHNATSGDAAAPARHVAPAAPASLGGFGGLGGHPVLSVPVSNASLAATDSASLQGAANDSVPQAPRIDLAVQGLQPTTGDRQIPGQPTMIQTGPAQAASGQTVSGHAASSQPAPLPAFSHQGAPAQPIPAQPTVPAAQGVPTAPSADSAQAAPTATTPAFAPTPTAATAPELSAPVPPATASTGAMAPKAEKVATAVDASDAAVKTVQQSMPGQAESQALLTPVNTTPTTVPAHTSALSRMIADPAIQNQALQQVATAIEASHKGSGRMELRLDPPELGRVSIDFRFDGDNRVTAILHADQPETATLMRRSLDILMRDLASAGFTDVNVTMGSGGRDAGQAGQQQAGQHQAERHSHSGGQYGSAREHEQQAQKAPQAYRPAWSADTIDIRL